MNDEKSYRLYIRGKHGRDGDYTVSWRPWRRERVSSAGSPDRTSFELDRAASATCYSQLKLRVILTMVRIVAKHNDPTLTGLSFRLVMRKRLNLCSTASAKRRRQSLVLGRGAIGDRAWQARARACANVSGGEEKFCARSVGKCRRYKIVCVLSCP